MSSPVEYLRYMRDEIAFLERRSAGESKREFDGDETLQRAFVRSLEVIGEAVKHLPADFRAGHPTVDWRAIAGMRDRLIHDYLGVDYDLVWDAVMTEAPGLRKQLEAIFEHETSSEDVQN